MKRIWIIFVAALILSIVADFLLQGGEGHGEFAWSRILGFFAVFGFISCVAIVIISKYLGHHWLQRKENYYDRDNGDE